MEFSGCKVTRTFNPGLTENWASWWQGLLDDGYQEAWFDASFNWGVVNLKERKIVSNTEGDMDVIVCPTDRALHSELFKHKLFFERMGQKSNIDEILEELG